MGESAFFLRFFLDSYMGRWGWELEEKLPLNNRQKVGSRGP